MSEDEKEPVKMQCPHSSIKPKNGKYVCTRCGDPVSHSTQRDTQTY